MISRRLLVSVALGSVVCCAFFFVAVVAFSMREVGLMSAINSRSFSRLPKAEEQNNGALIDSINVVPPKFGHAPVRPATVETCRDVLGQLPTKIYRLLEESGATINVAPNIEDNWPGSGDGERPGELDMTMGEEPGRCYDRAVWLYESEKVRGSQELKPPRSQDQMRATLYQLLGHAINDCLGVPSKREELISAYSGDIDDLPLLARVVFYESTQRTDESTALGCSEIIGVLIGGKGNHDDFLAPKYFPRTTAYLRKMLLNE